VAERFNAPVLKTESEYPINSKNPSISRVFWRFLRFGAKAKKPVKTVNDRQWGYKFIPARFGLSPAL
jgi:hypothetical protein